MALVAALPFLGTALALGAFSLHAQTGEATTLGAEVKQSLPDAPSALQASPATLQDPAPMVAELKQFALAVPEAPTIFSSSVTWEAPYFQGSAPTPGGRPVQPPRIAPLHWKYIPAGYNAQKLGTHGKLAVGATDLYSWSNFAAMFLSSGYSQWTNGQPNYGTDKGAYGQRLGAAAIRETTQGVFTDMVFAPLLHEDPRYYQLGPKYGYVHRTVYSVTRALVTRTDSGHHSVNGALLLGYAASAAVNTAYYPSINRNAHDVLSSWGGSVGGAALGYFVSEFTSDVLIALHLQHPE